MNHTYSILLLLTNIGIITASDNTSTHITPFALPQDEALNQMSMPEIQQLNTHYEEHIALQKKEWAKENFQTVYGATTLSVVVPAICTKLCCQHVIGNALPDGVKAVLGMIPSLTTLYVCRNYLESLAITPELSDMKNKIDMYLKTKEKEKQE